MNSVDNANHNGNISGSRGMEQNKVSCLSSVRSRKGKEGGNYILLIILIILVMVLWAVNIGTPGD